MVKSILTGTDGPVTFATLARTATPLPAKAAQDRGAKSPTLSESFAKLGLDAPAAVIKASQEAEAAIAKLETGAKENAKAMRAAKLQMARSKLDALRIEAIFSARLKDAKAAKRVAAEAAKVARELKAMRNEGADETASAASETAPVSRPISGPVSGAATDPAQTAKTTNSEGKTGGEGGGARQSSPAVLPEGEASQGAAQPQAASLGANQAASKDANPVSASSSDPNKEIDAIIQYARKVIAIARKALQPGSNDDRDMARLQNGTGVPDLGTDVVTEGDMSLSPADGPSHLNVSA